MALSVQCLLSTHEALSSDPQQPWKEPGTGVHIGNPRAGCTEAEGLLEHAYQLVFPISEFQVH